jgi:hypothetical protein
MLETGHELALEAGIGLSLADFSMEEVIQRARVPRSSVYRLWAYKDDYMDDLLCHMAGPGRWFAGQGAFDPETFRVVESTIVDNADLLNTAEGRRAILREIVRVAVRRNYDVGAQNRKWRIHVALIATIGSGRRDEIRDRIATTLEQTQAHSRRSMANMYRRMLVLLGLRLRDETLTIDHLITATSALMQGLTLRNVLAEAAAGAAAEAKAQAAAIAEGRAVADTDESDAAESEVATGATEHALAADLTEADEEADNEVDAQSRDEVDEDSGALTARLLNVPIPGPGLHGEKTEWSLAAHAYLALLDAFLEPDPDHPSNRPASA